MSYRLHVHVEYAPSFRSSRSFFTSQCNGLFKTHDGIELMAARAVKEAEVAVATARLRVDTSSTLGGNAAGAGGSGGDSDEIQITLVGHSLGGLIARYMVGLFI